MFNLSENYIILREYIKCVLPPLIEMVGFTMNLISDTHYFCERREYAFFFLDKSTHLIYMVEPVKSNSFLCIWYIKQSTTESNI